ALDEEEEEKTNKRAFLEKYNRMLNARKNKSTYFDHQCSKRTCNPMNEKQMIANGLIRSKSGGPHQLRNGSASSFNEKSRDLNLDSTMFVCEYGTMHLCNKNVPSSWYRDTVPYSPCELVSTHTGEIC